MPPEADGPMNMVHAWIEKAMNMGTPRRYIARRLHDSYGLEQKEIADLLDVSQPTVHRDLESTVPPAGRTPKGTPFYPPGRFDKDREFTERVAELTHDCGAQNARVVAAREFAGPDPNTPNSFRECDEAQLERMRKFAKEYGPKAA